MTDSKWVICWFLEGFGPGWISKNELHLLPWTGDVLKALTFASKEDADRMLIEWEMLDFGGLDVWVEPVDKDAIEAIIRHES